MLVRLLAVVLLVTVGCAPEADRPKDSFPGGLGGAGGSGGTGEIGEGGTGGRGEGGTGGSGEGGTGGGGGGTGGGEGGTGGGEGGTGGGEGGTGGGEGGTGGGSEGGTGGTGEGGTGGTGEGGTGGTGEGGTGGSGEGGAGGTGGVGGTGGSGGGPPLPANSRAMGWAEVWCQRLALGFESPGYPPVGPSPDPHAYLYAAANAQQGAALRATLHDLLTPHAVLSYYEARLLMFGELDDRNGDVTCVYTGRVIHAGGSIPDHTVMNTEHSWAQSWFTDADKLAGAKSDLHHLFPTDNDANSTRDNYPFGHPKISIKEAYDPTRPTTLTGSRLGDDAAGRRVFEPRNEHKGNLARALLYFAVRYGRSIEPWQEEVLRCWNALDPPDADEVARTNGIELAEGTRNPFVDHPEYVDRIDDF